MNTKTIFTFLFLFTLFVDTIFSQGKPYEGPEDPAGDIAAEKEGYMTGNRVFIYFRNTTELSDWPRVNVSKWPNNPDGLKMTDGIGLLIGAKVYIEDDGDPSTVDTIPITELPELLNPNNEVSAVLIPVKVENAKGLTKQKTINFNFFII